MFSREQKALIRDWFAETAETLARAIEQEINRIVVLLFPLLLSKNASSPSWKNCCRCAKD